MINLFADINSPPTAPTEVIPTIELRGISQTYDKGKITIFNDLNLRIDDPTNKGRFVAILGPSGCGKSTLLRYIAGLQKPTAGQVLMHGLPRTENDRVGMVFQRYSSLPWLSVLENIQIGARYQGISDKESRDRAFEMLRLVGLEGQEEKYAIYPNLSGGQLQRVAIARSLLANPKILLMDEPFGALDVKTRLKMQDSIHSIALALTLSARSRNEYASTIISVTHDISEAVYLADEIWVMGGSPSTLKRKVIVPFLQKAPELKKTPEFQRMVNELEDYMMEPS